MRLAGLTLLLLVVPQVPPKSFFFAAPPPAGGPTCGGTTVISENFNDMDISDWTVTGTVNVSSGAAVVSTASGSHYATKTHTEYGTLWALFDLTWTFSSWSNTNVSVDTGFRSTYWGQSMCAIGGVGTASSSAPEFRLGYFENTEQGTSTGDAFASGTTYTIKIFMQAATTTSSNDGIIRVWATGGAYSNTLIYERTNVDNGQVQQIDFFEFGSRYTDGVSGGTLTIDNILVCTTEPT